MASSAVSRPPVVVSIPVAVGDEVDEGDVVAVVEAMKMETSLTAPFHGRVRAVLAGTNVHVAAQAPLVALEPLDGGPPPAAGERISFAPTAPTAPTAQERLQRLAWLVLGYDVDAREAERIVGGFDDDPELIAGEHRLLRMFADVHALSRPRHDEADPETPWLRSPQEHLNAWLGSLDPEAAGLPEAFLALLRAALAHYGIAGLDRTPALEEACYRLYLTQERTATARAAIVSILERRLDRVAAPAGAAGEDFREALDHLILTMEGRDPVVADLAREVRYHYFDEPVIVAAREGVYTEMEAHVAALAEHPQRSGPRRAHRGARRLPAATRVAPQRAHARGRTAGAARPRRGNGAPLLPGALTRGLRARVHRRPRAADLALSVRGPPPPPRGCLRRARRRRSPR